MTRIDPRSKPLARSSTKYSRPDAQLYEERYNLLNAYLAAVPGGSAFNLRRLHITNANHADYSFCLLSIPASP